MPVARTSSCILAALAVGLAIAAPAARAGELTIRIVSVTGPRGEPDTGEIVTFVADPGERNVVDVRYDDGVLRLRDLAGVRPPARCGTEADGAVACPLVRVFQLEAQLADGDDELSAPHGLAVLVDGGDGDDRITGGGSLSGGAGRDELHTRTGGNVLSGGPGGDLLDPAITHSGWERLGARAAGRRERNERGWAGLLPHYVAACQPA